MNIRNLRVVRSLFLTLGVSVAGLLVGSTSWAAATVCTTVGLGTPTLKLAIASNFYGPAQTVAQNFINASGGSVSAVLVCMNSTAHLDQEIVNGTQLPPDLLPDTGFPRYDYFFAANSDTPISLQASTGKTAYLYANGTPVLYSSTNLNPSVTTVGDLITGLGSATSATISSTSLSSFAIDGHAQFVAVADPTAAPYGVAAKNITTAMGYVWSGNVPPSPPVLPSLFANIDLTFASVGTMVNGQFVGAAFAAKSQICPNLGSVEYVQFTGFPTVQYAIQLTTSAVTNSFDSYLRGQFNSGSWNTFLTLNCYQPIEIRPAPLGNWVAPVMGLLLLVAGVSFINRRSGSKGAPVAA